MIELWIRHILSGRWHDLEAFCQRVLQTEHPELYVERRGGTGDEGRDLVIKTRKSQVIPHGVCQVSAERPWQHKFRRELKNLVEGVKADDPGEPPALWIFLTTQPVHEKKRPSRTEKPRDKDDELAWAKGFLEKQSRRDIEIEIWGFQDLVEIVAHPQKGKLIRDEFGLSQLFTEGLDDWIKRLKLFTEARVDQTVTQMPVLGHIRRIEQELLRESVKEHGATLLLGEGGAGKSGIVTAEAVRLIRGGYPVLYLRADRLPSNLQTPDQIGAHIGIAKPLVQVLTMIGGVTGECYLFFDQMSFVMGTESSLTLCSLAQTVRNVEGVHVVVVCRSHQAGITGEIQQLGFPVVEARPLGHDLVSELLQRLGIQQPSQLLIGLGGNMLHLSIIAELVRDGTNVADLSGEAQLWARYVDSISTREGADTLATAVDLACETLRQRRRESYILNPDLPTRRLISRGILVETNAHVYRFRHDVVQDYLYAWDATRQKKPAGDMLGEVGELFFPAIGDWVVKIYRKEKPELALAFAREVFYG